MSLRRTGCLFLLVGVALAYVASFLVVVVVSRQDQRQKTDAIVVLGAAQYNGRPSPVLKARLDHGIKLYQAGLAPLLMVTGGTARAVPIADTQNVLSSAHAALQRSGREVSLVDLGSLNGTHVAGPEATEWTQLEPGVAHPLSDGDRLLLGWTVITFEQPND